MRLSQLNEAMKIAQSNADLSKEMSQIHIFDGFGLPDFKPVVATIRQLATLIRWQTFQFNGGIDAEALNEIVYFGRRRFLILD